MLGRTKEFPNRDYPGLVATGEDAAPSGLSLGRAARDPLALPGTIALAVFFVFEVKGGGYAAVTWYPGALVFLALATFSARSHLRRGTRLSRAAAVATTTFGLYTVWSFLSIIWADAKGDALDGSNRTLLYFLVFVFFALTPWRLSTAAYLLGIFALAVAGLGMVELVRAGGAASPDAFFQLGRFAQPMNYQNATCALFLMAFWPVLMLASRREVPASVRVLAAGACAVLPELALLCQSRASLVAFPLALVVYLIVVPSRARTVIFLIPGAVALAASYSRLLGVFPAIRDSHNPMGAIVEARNVVIGSAIACMAAGWLLAMLDQRTLGRVRIRRMARTAVAAVAVCAVATGGALAARKLEHPVAQTQRAWRSFKVVYPATRRSYFSAGLGGNRYDVWRVAVHEIAHAPIVGVGVDNFAVDYLQLRHSLEEPQYPHSVELRVVAQTGVVGGVLFAVFLVAAVAGLRRLFELGGLARAVAGASLAVVAYWLLHGSVDWFWEMPGLGGVACACLGLSLGVAEERGERARGRGSRALVVSGSAAAALATVVLALPWLAAAEVARAASSWRTDPGAAFRRLETARQLNVLSDMPDLVAGAIASRVGDRPRMVAAFERALARNRRDWYANLELGVAAALDGRRTVALKRLEAARRLDPLEPTIRALTRDIRAGRRISPPELDRVFLARIRA